MSKPQKMLLLSLTLTSLALAGCVKPPPPVLIPVPETLRSACAGPSTEGVQQASERVRVATEADREAAMLAALKALASFSLDQEAALVACDARRAEAVGLIDRRNEQVTPKPWWRFGR